MNILCAVLIVIISAILSAWINKGAVAVWVIGYVAGMISIALIERE